MREVPQPRKAERPTAPFESRYSPSWPLGGAQAPSCVSHARDHSPLSSFQLGGDRVRGGGGAAGRGALG